MSANEYPVFHSGEQAAQTRAGMREHVAQVERRLVRDFMPDEHRELFGRLPMLFAGSLDPERRPWASVLVGPPGFISTPDARTLRAHGRPLRGDPFAHLRVGAAVGLLGIEFATRRRNRMNGTVIAAGDDGFSVRVEQSFGNCPKYIQARTPRWVADAASFSAAPVVREAAALSADAGALIRRADTFFIASAAPEAATAGHATAHGVDVSHRGGRPGFVQISNDRQGTVLTMPDYAGNNLFNTLGNLLLHPRAGLLFVDFDRGDLLGLTTEIDIVWDGPAVAAFAGAQRLLRFRAVQGWYAAHALPLRWSAPEYSPHLPGPQAARPL
jgi:predicted pyridoxine 5'-phosphate oxidase superfamily flavin-nucleotide-binding protein